MRTLPNMSLTMWDQVEDLYDHVQQAVNLAKIDAHDHTPGRGVLLTTESIETGSITEPLLSSGSVSLAKLTTPVAEKLWPLKTAVRASNFTAANHEMAECTATVTATLPSGAILDQTIGLAAVGGVVTIKTAEGDDIYGDFTHQIAGVTEIKLTVGQHVIFQSNSSGNWWVVAGTGKREQEWSAQVSRAIGTLFTPNAIRPTKVALAATGGSNPWRLKVNGVQIAEQASGTSSLMFDVNPSQTWEIEQSAPISTFKSSYLTG